MNYIIPHGGSCCGIRHLRRFSDTPKQEASALASNLRNSYLRPRGRAVEVVLTDSQSRKYGDSLAKEGFIPVFRFKNSNTGHLLTVFYFHENPLPLDALPFSFDPEKAPDPEKPILTVRTRSGTQVRVVSSRSTDNGRIGTLVGYRAYAGTFAVRFSSHFSRSYTKCFAEKSLEIV